MFQVKWIVIVLITQAAYILVEGKECVHELSHSRALIDQVYEYEPAGSAALDINKFQAQLSTLSTNTRNYLSKIRTLMDTVFAPSNRPALNPAKDSYQRLKMAQTGIITVQECGDNPPISVCGAAGGTWLTFHTVTEKAEFREIMNQLGIETAFVAASYSKYNFITPKGNLIGGLTSSTKASGETAGNRNEFHTHWEKFQHVVYNSTINTVHPVRKSEPTTVCLCSSRESPVETNQPLFDSLKSMLGQVLKQLPRIKIARRVFAQHLAKLATHSVVSPNVKRIFSSSVPLIRRLLASFVLPLNLKHIDKVDLTQLTSISNLIPRLLLKLKSFSGKLGWTDSGVEKRFQPHALKNGLLLGDLLQTPSKPVDIYRIYPHLLYNNYVLSDKYLIHHVAANIWHTSRTLPTLTNCKYIEGKRVCSILMPPITDPDCGTAISAIGSLVVRACPLAEISRPLVMLTPCNTNRLIGLFPDGIEIMMQCMGVKFEYEVSRGTSLFNANCDLYDKANSKLYAAAHLDEPVVQPSTKYFPVAAISDGEHEISKNHPEIELGSTSVNINQLDTSSDQLSDEDPSELDDVLGNTTSKYLIIGLSVAAAIFGMGLMSVFGCSCHQRCNSRRRRRHVDNSNEATDRFYPKFFGTPENPTSYFNQKDPDIYTSPITRSIFPRLGGR